MPPAGFDELPPEEKVEYVQSLWERIARHPEDLPSPDWHLEIVEKRLSALEQDGDKGRPWSEVRRELQERLRTARR